MSLTLVFPMIVNLCSNFFHYFMYYYQFMIQIIYDIQLSLYKILKFLYMYLPTKKYVRPLTNAQIPTVQKIEILIFSCTFGTTSHNFVQDAQI